MDGKDGWEKWMGRAQMKEALVWAEGQPAQIVWVRITAAGLSRFNSQPRPVVVDRDVHAALNIASAEFATFARCYRRAGARQPLAQAPEGRSFWGSDSFRMHQWPLKHTPTKVAILAQLAYGLGYSSGPMSHEVRYNSATPGN